MDRADMTHPLTPREKVPSMPTVELTDDMLFEVAPGEIVTWAEIKRRTALASSGDHAELARLADRNVELSVLAYKWMEAHDALKSGQPYDYPSPADVPTLLAENAALRASVVKANDGFEEYERRFYLEQERATEAERKLAEAVGLNDRAADLMRQCTDPDRFEGASTLNVYANMRAWLSDLSKEAERGCS